jgi:hypothetical protein
VHISVYPHYTMRPSRSAYNLKSSTCSAAHQIHSLAHSLLMKRIVERKAGNDVGQAVSIAHRSGPVSGTGLYLSTKSRSPFPSLSILSAAHLSTPPSPPRRLSSRRAPTSPPPLRV